MVDLNNDSDSLLATSLCEEIEIVNVEDVISCTNASTQTNNIQLLLMLVHNVMIMELMAYSK